MNFPTTGISFPGKKLSSDIFKLNNLKHTFFGGMANDGKKLKVFFI